MEQILEVKREGENFRASLYYKGKNKKVHYWNIISTDKKRLAQIFLDLVLEGVPIDEAFKLYRKKIDNKDWMGI